MKIKKAQFLISSPDFNGCPELNLPEFALLGRSNVGKSSFINTLANNFKLAKTSNTPGKTRLINLFVFNDDFVIADLPGYGYAKVSQEIKEKWGKMIERYLQKSKQLKLVFLLIDIRHEPSANDKNMYEWIEYNGFEPVIIATKLDKINRSQVQKHIKMLRTGLGLKKETILIPFSSETKQGKEEVWNIIDSYLAAGQDGEEE